MKVTNISQYTLYLNDLRVFNESLGSGLRGEDLYLGPGQAIYLPNTSEVLRSAIKGDLGKWRDHGFVTLEDQVTLSALGGGSDSVVLTHNFGFAPTVYVLKQVGVTWVDATGTVDIVHNAGLTAVTVTNVTAFALTFLIRLG